jgi:sorbitol-specific phosphotransferase system component IIC
VGYKINHYAKPTKATAVFGWEAILKDLSLGLVSTGMCYFGIQTEIVLLAFPMGIVAIMFYAGALITLIGLFRDYLFNIKKKKLKDVEKDLED